MVHQVVANTPREREEGALEWGRLPDRRAFEGKRGLGGGPSFPLRHLCSGRRGTEERWATVHISREVPEISLNSSEAPLEGPLKGIFLQA